MLGGPRIQRQRLGTFHVGIEPTEPDQPGRAACAGAHGDPAPAITLADPNEGRFLLDYSGFSHGFVTLARRFVDERAI